MDPWVRRRIFWPETVENKPPVDTRKRSTSDPQVGLWKTLLQRLKQAVDLVVENRIGLPQFFHLSD